MPDDQEIITSIAARLGLDLGSYRRTGETTPRKWVAFDKTGRLVRLDLFGLRLTELPDEVFQLTNLTSLYLSGIQLGSLPPEIGQLTNLTKLNLRYTELTSLPAEIGQLVNLTSLDLCGTQLISLPPEIGLLTNLTNLDLSNTKFTGLPPEIGLLTNLTSLDLRGIPLKSLPPEIGQLTNLTSLELRDTQLGSLPPEIGQLTNLTSLHLSSTQLGSLPPEIGQLTNLTSLHLSSTQLTSLPPEIGQLTNLTSLHLSNTPLTSLPAKIGQLTSLTSLDLSNTWLSRLPAEISQLSGLKKLRLDNTPLVKPPPEIARAGNNIEAIRNYFAELARTKETDYLYEAKLLLVGEGRVGKTSLAKTLAVPGYILADEPTTEGIDVQPWIIPKKSLGLPKDFRLNIWDFGGQEIYHATHQFFLTKRSVYLLVTESRKEDKHEDFYYWLNIVQLLGANSPVIIVLNKCDQPTKDLPINEYRQAFGNIADFEKISCAAGYRDTIDILMTKIRRVITNSEMLPHVGTPLPKVWVDIRNALERLRQSGNDYISLDIYLNLCSQYDLNEERAFYLSDFFHDLGVVLHFKDDLALRDTVILNSEWVTRGVYAVLDNERVKANQGRFSDADLIDIWRDDRYKAKRQEMLSLMKDKKFELCYQLEPGHYLAPQLLPVDAIEYPWRTTKDNLRFEYRYKFMPKGILARFIVKRHRDIYKQTHWRYGVLLEYEDTRALVRELYFERKISIALEGTNKKGFLEIIRKTIAEIHQDFHNLQVEEMIPCNCEECRAAAEPFMYRYSELLRFRNKLGRLTRECGHSGLDVNIDMLINDVMMDRQEGDFSDLVAGRVQSLHRQLAGRYANLNKLKEQLTVYGAGQKPLDLLNQIEAEEKEIARLEEELAAE